LHGFQAKLREKIEYNDLEGEESSSAAPALKLARLDPYLHGPTPVIAMQYSTSEDMIHACQAFTQEMMAWQSQQTQVCSHTHLSSIIINYKFIKLQPFIRFVDVSAATAAFIRMTVQRQVSTRRTVSSHRCVEVGRTPRLGSSTCPVLS